MTEEKKRAPQSYYTISVEQSNSEGGKDYPLFVNCTGEVYEKRKFNNVNNLGRNDYYLMYMQEGTLELTLNGVTQPFTSGQLVCFPPHTPYNYNNQKCEGVISYYWLHFTGREPKKLLDMCALPLGQVITVGLHNEASAHFESLFSEFRNRKDNFEFAIGLKAQYILFLLARYKTEAETPPRVLDISIKYIHEHFRRRITLSELCNMEFLSASRYRELFREATGFSPTDYIKRQRIHRACDLLSQGHSLSRAAELTGYSDRLYFQRVFKSIMGITPGEYKKKYH